MSPATTLIRGATVMTAAGAADADVLIEGARIDRVCDRAAGRPPEADGVLDADGLWLLPGGIDAHTHFGMPLGPSEGGGLRSLGWRASSEAALLGGTTTIIDFANPEPGEALRDAVARWRAAADGRCLCDYGLHVTVTDTSPERLAEIPRLVEAGLPTFKAFLAYKGRLMLAPDELEALMRAVHAAGGMALLHAEDGEMNAAAEAEIAAAGHDAAKQHPAAHPPRSETAAVATGLRLATATGCRLLVVHVSLADSARLIRDARAAGDDVFGEACLHHCLRDESLYAAGDDDALRAVLSPPLRASADRRAIADALVAGDLELLSTDHCEFPLAVKKAAAARGLGAIPNGAGGVGERLTLARSIDGLDTGRWIDVCCETPARLMGLGRKGGIEAGRDADLVLFDPAAAGDWRPLGDSDPEASLWRGEPARGRVVHVLRRGRLVVRDGVLADEIEPGAFLPRRRDESE